MSVCFYDKTSQSRPIYFGLFWLRISVHGHLVLSSLGQSVRRQSITEVLNSAPGQSCSLQNSQETENKQTNKSKQIFNTGALGTILYLNHKTCLSVKVQISFGSFVFAHLDMVYKMSFCFFSLGGGGGVVVVVFCFMVLWIKPRALYMIGNYFVTELQFPAIKYI